MSETNANDNNLKNKHHHGEMVMFILLALFLLAVLIILSTSYYKSHKVVKSNFIYNNNQTNFSNSVLPASKPSRIVIDSINVNAPVTELGLNHDRTLQVPSIYSDVGWYTNSPTPGELGPSILVGHLDSAKAAAVFYHLKDLKQGDKIQVKRADGSIANFKVDAMQIFSQDNFPTEKVYGSINYSGLRLITCAGSFNQSAGHYTDNLVVYASLTDSN
ncbi:MAG: hypothetical protein NVSMB66_4320 [Candidatus Doudnabacteria bacterium]